MRALAALLADPHVRQRFPDGTLSPSETFKELEWIGHIDDEGISDVHAVERPAQHGVMTRGRLPPHLRRRGVPSAPAALRSTPPRSFAEQRRPALGLAFFVCSLTSSG